MSRLLKPKHKVEVWIDSDGNVRVRDEWKQFGQVHWRVAKLKPELLRETIEGQERER